jgi:hypothetical protein
MSNEYKSPSDLKKTVLSLKLTPEIDIADGTAMGTAGITNPTSIIKMPFNAEIIGLGLEVTETAAEDLTDGVIALRNADGENICTLSLADAVPNLKVIYEDYANVLISGAAVAAANREVSKDDLLYLGIQVNGTDSGANAGKGNAFIRLREKYT